MSLLGIAITALMIFSLTSPLIGLAGIGLVLIKRQRQAKPLIEQKLALFISVLLCIYGISSWIHWAMINHGKMMRP